MWLLILQVACRAILLGGPPPPPEQAPAWSVVTVLPGDGVASLATRYQVTEEELRTWNSLPEGEWEIGDRIRVHSTVVGEERMRMRFKVRTETTWRRLADKYALPLKTLLALNKRKRGGRIKPGRRVTVYVPKSRWNGLWLDGAVQLQEGPGVIVKHPKWAWGRPTTVRTIAAVGKALCEAFPGSAVVVGDLSRKRGGRFPPHTSHRGGLDADIGLLLQDEPYTVKFRHVKPAALDAQRTWAMVKLFIDSGRVERILLDWYLQSALYETARAGGATEEELKEYFQYPARRWRKQGLIRHYKGHKNHIHIRFREVPGEAIL